MKNVPSAYDKPQGGMHKPQGGLTVLAPNILSRDS